MDNSNKSTSDEAKTAEMDKDMPKKEATPAAEVTPVAESAPTAETAAPKKKSRKTLFIILGIVGALVLCGLICAGIYFAFRLALNNDHTKQVEELFDALHADDKAKVETLVESTIYEELYYEYEDGTIAEEFADNVANLDITGTTVTTNGVKVFFNLDLTNDEYGFEDWKEAGLQEQDNGEYLIVYVGPETDQTEE